MQLVLASASPRRRQLLERLGRPFEVRPPDIDEAPLIGEAPAAYVERLARAKAQAGVWPGELVVAADTTVDVDGEILGKPLDDGDARRMLSLLCGREHRVHTGLALAWSGGVVSAVVTSEVTFSEMTEPDKDWYLATREGHDKAGAYALQGAGGVFVRRLTGSVSNAVGLPLCELVELARAHGFELLMR